MKAHVEFKLSPTTVGSVIAALVGISAIVFPDVGLGNLVTPVQALLNALGAIIVIIATGTTALTLRSIALARASLAASTLSIDEHRAERGLAPFSQPWSTMPLYCLDQVPTATSPPAYVPPPPPANPGGN